MNTITRLFTGDDGQSHFSEETLSYQKVYPDWDLLVSNAFSIEGGQLVIWETCSEFELTWVNAPRKQFVIYLAGVVDIEVGGGEKRRFKQGDVLLAEDCEGQGHITRVIEPIKAVVVSTL